MSIVTENPLRKDLLTEQIPEPCVIVIFGATGDLTKRKLITALYDQAMDGHLPNGFCIIGIARTQMTDDDFRTKMRNEIEKHARNLPVDIMAWEEFAANIFYISFDLANPDAFNFLLNKLNEVSVMKRINGNRIFYMAIPPSQIKDAITIIKKSGLAVEHLTSGEPYLSGYSRIIIEKPFGQDLKSAQELNYLLLDTFKEDQIYRIDHYLGKETVQNILVFRFANGIFEPLWNRRYIDHIQIIVAESIGVEGRAKYYEEAGALRDMVQNHMLQLLTLVAMEPPSGFTAYAVRDEKIKVLRTIRPIKEKEVEQIVRAQYGDGWSQGKKVCSYKNEAGVDLESVKETYCALKLYIDNWRWGGVPFYIRTGKRLPKRVTEVAIQFRDVPHLMFKQTPVDDIEPNILVLRIQPDEGISLKFCAKLPGPRIHLRSVNMDFRYVPSFGASSQDAYERLLLDCMLGDSTLFHRNDAVLASWEVVMPILSYWESFKPQSIPIYESGTWGPEEANCLIKKDGRCWRNL